MTGVSLEWASKGLFVLDFLYLDCRTPNDHQCGQCGQSGVLTLTSKWIFLARSFKQKLFRGKGRFASLTALTAAELSYIFGA